MHPHTKPTTVVLIICMVILGILLLPLPLTAYKVLKFFLSLFLLYPAGFFLLPCKKMSFQPSTDRLEYGTRNPADGTFSGTLEDTRTRERVEELDEENSQLAPFVAHGHLKTEGNTLPRISLQLSLGLAVTAVIMNPFTGIRLPRSSWMFLDVVILALLGWAIHVIREENAGNRPYVSLTGTVGQPPTFPFLPVFDVFRHAVRLWPAVLGSTFVIALLGTQIGEGEFEDIRLGNLVGQTVGALVVSSFYAWLIYCFVDLVSAYSEKRQQVPGEFFITVFLLILLSLTFSGYFTPKPPFDLEDAPDGYVPYERSDDY